MVIDSSDSIFAQFCRNKILMTTVFAWISAQVIKVFANLYQGKRFNFKWLFSSGGMPSSHVAVSMCLSASIGLYYGFDSGLFVMALAFAGITMFDAQGVRRHSGKQAEILNKIMEDLYAHKGFQEAHLKEFVGHTPIEVYAGGFYGILLAILAYRVMS